MSGAFSGAPSTTRRRLGDCLEEVARGVGDSWTRFRVVGATRAGIAPAKEPVGKNPERYKLVETGTIFYNPMRILLGSIAMIDDGQEPGITSPDYVVFRSKVGVVHPRWLYHWLRSQDGAAFIKTLARGAVRERLLFRRLAVGQIDIPPYEMQLRFAAAILVVERARAAAEARLEAAKSLMFSFIRSLFEQEESSAWPTRRIAEFAQTSSGRTPSRSRSDYYGGRMPWVKSSELLDGLVEDTEEHVTSKAVEECRLRVFPARTCLVAMYGQGQTRGRTGLLTRPATINQACFAILPNDAEFDAGFLQGWFRYSYRRLRTQTEGRGGNQPNLSGALLRNEKVPLPSKANQKRIAAEIAERGQHVRALLASLAEELSAAKRLREVLLQRTFGEEL